MTSIISFRSKRPKSELKERFGNISGKLNELIEREIARSGAAPADWRDVLQRERPVISKKVFQKCMRPE